MHSVGSQNARPAAFPLNMFLGGVCSKLDAVIEGGDGP